MSTHEEAIAAAKAAYWSVVHHGSGYGDECYEAAISAYLAARSAVLCQSAPAGYAMIDDDTGKMLSWAYDIKGTEWFNNYRATTQPLHAPLSPTDTATEFKVVPRGGIEHRKYRKLVKAAQFVVSETDRIHDKEPWPIKYRAPYEAIAKLRTELGSSDPTDTVTAGRVERYRHKKRGTEYVLVGVGRMQAENWGKRVDGVGYSPVDMREVVIYRSIDDGSLWIRPREEFEDGRFEKLEDALTTHPEAGKGNEVERLEDKIEDLIAEFGDDPTAALQCVSEHIELRRHARNFPKGYSDEQR